MMKTRRINRWITCFVLCCAAACAVSFASGYDRVQAAQQRRGASRSFYVATNGDDRWSGTLPASRRGDGPFRTLARARDAVRELKRGGKLTNPVTIYVRGGTHFLDQPLVLTPEDSGTATAPVTYAAYRNERPILSGGVRLDGWRRQGRFWIARVSASVADDLDFSQMWAGDGRRPRARTPNEGFLRVAELPGVDFKLEPKRSGSDNFRFAPGDINQSWTNLSDAEVVIVNYWAEARLPIKEVDAANRIVRFTRRTRRRMTEDFTRQPARYFVENFPEALDAPGEWYFDRRTRIITYLPLAGERLDRFAAVIPRLTTLVRFDGDPAANAYVEHVRLRGLTFSHNEWRLPRDGTDAGDNQAAVDAAGAIGLRGARDITLDDNVFAHFGSYGIRLDDGCRRVNISRNRMHDGAAGGIHVTGGNASSPEASRTGDITIEDNHLYDLGRVYLAAVGILLRHTAGNRVRHNHIHDLYYTGISAGWVWGYKPSVTRDNLIEYNHIHDIGKAVLSDMGGIYTLGASPGTIIRGNLIHDIDSASYGGWGIYTDEGSSGIIVERNLVYRTKSNAFNQHYGQANIVRNNIFVAGRDAVISNGRADPAMNQFTLTGNILVTSGKPVYAGSNRADIRRPSFTSDRNLIFDTATDDRRPEFAATGNPHSAAGVKLGWDEWRATGNDRNSVFADPLFVDARRGDYTLRSDSPAFANLNFAPLDLSRVGPRRAPARLATAAQSR